ncbi:uncharacterized protein LOC112171244 [Rosa chinensis]|uniref:uncharacterized protein LOC112171244 n=1 Tax=Rosa chinensis TaxID=74649 RepID=UPI000D096EC4|nr:uncharacterized protein LOC112171244 [Rosa chinensis]
MSPFQAVYGTPPPLVSMYTPGSMVVHSVDRTLQDRNALLQLLKLHMSQAQNKMKQHADSNRTEKEFQVGDWVFLKLHPYRQQSLVKRPSHKLSPRYHRPFKVQAQVGKVAYRLYLPPHSKIHPVFHVSLLKKRVSDDIPLSSTLPHSNSKGELVWQPLKVLDMTVCKKKKRSVTKWFIQWASLPVEDAT